jgi:hypothetical protein
LITLRCCDCSPIATMHLTALRDRPPGAFLGGVRRIDNQLVTLNERIIEAVLASDTSLVEFKRPAAHASGIGSTRVATGSSTGRYTSPRSPASLWGRYASSCSVRFERAGQS